jgi:large subunit ribosomal protein L4
VEEYKTKTIAAMLKALGVSKKATIVTAEPNAKLIASAGNIAGVSTAVVNALNAYEIMNAGKFIISAEAVDKIEEVYSK